VLRERDAPVFGAVQRAHVPLAENLAGGCREPVAKVVQIPVATLQECVRAYLGAGAAG